MIHQLNFRGPLAKFITNFLKNRRFTARIGTRTSREYEQDQGVPQGSVLSCTLFLIAINEILSDLPNYVTGLLYVDDLVMYTSSKYLPAIERRLQTAIGRVERWTASHGFKFSMHKTVVVHFHRKRGLQTEPTILLYNNPIRCEKTENYLGMVFDQRLRWSEHITLLKLRATKALDILKCVSGTKWGGDIVSLLRLYRSLIRSKLDYASFNYWTASESELKKIDPVHNAALRLATGAFRTSPVESLYAETGEMSLKMRRIQLALQYYVRVIQDPESPVYSAVTNEVESEERASTFGQRVAELLREFGVGSPSIYQVARLIDPVWLIPSIVCTDFNPPKKTESNVLLLKQLFYQHIYDNHRNSNHIYTDGSKSGDEVGCAVLFGGELYSKRLAKDTGIYNAELIALFKAVKLARDDNRSTSTVIFTDSQSVKNSIENRNTDHPLISKMLHSILEAHRGGKRITVCWVPAHIGIPQNEQADEGARAAAASDVLIRNPRIHYRDYYPIIRRMIYARWEQIWSDVTDNKLRSIKATVKPWSSSSQRNRRLEVMLCKLRIGHTRMTHKWILEGNEAPLCEHCIEPLTVKHFLTECDLYTHLRNRIYPHTVNMDGETTLKSILGESNDKRELKTYLTMTGLVNEI